MSFKNMVLRNNENVFMNPDEFADLRTITYDGDEYEDVRCVMSQLKAQDRPQFSSDHMQGIYSVTSILHFPVSSLGGNVPEKGSKITVTNDEDFPMEYYVAQSGCDHGMVRLELEALDE